MFNFEQIDVLFLLTLMTLQWGLAKMACNSIETSDGGGFIMTCRICSSDNQAEFAAEMVIHFSGLKNLDNPGVSVFPKLLVCLGCGFSRFTVPETALLLLANGPPAHETVTLERFLDRLAFHGRIALRKGA